MKKYNYSTGCYKIDVFNNGKYLHSTDQYKTCKAAKQRALEIYPDLDPSKVWAYFDKTY